MAARILDGKAIAARVRAEVRADVESLVAHGVTPGLAVVLVGEDPASQIYVRNKTRACAEVGIRTFDHALPATTDEATLLALIARLNADDAVDGILVQLPLPRAIDAEAVIEAVAPEKDVDGFHPENVGRLWLGRPRFSPCTPAGILRLIDESGLKLGGAVAVVVGRSAIVGKPAAALLAERNATVVLCHRGTRDLAAEVARADVLVVAAGRAGLIPGAWIKPGAIVIDVGITRVDGRVAGDVDFATAVARAGAITPVPGGVGPMTIAMLCANVARAARMRRGTK